jgi:hypothetical protein
VQRGSLKVNVGLATCLTRKQLTLWQATRDSNRMTYDMVWKKHIVT